MNYSNNYTIRDKLFELVGELYSVRVTSRCLTCFLAAVVRGSKQREIAACIVRRCDHVSHTQAEIFSQRCLRCPIAMVFALLCPSMRSKILHSHFIRRCVGINREYIQHTNTKAVISNEQLLINVRA